MGYAVIPRSYQEALVYVWTQSHPNFQGMPWSISPVVMKEVTEFATHYVRAPKDEAFFLIVLEKVIGIIYYSESSL